MFSHLLHQITRARTGSGARPPAGRVIAPLVCLALLLAPLAPTAPVAGQAENTPHTATPHTAVSPASTVAGSPARVVLATARTTQPIPALPAPTGAVIASRDEDPADQWCRPDQRHSRSDSDHRDHDHDRDRKDRKDRRKDRKHKHTDSDDSDDDRDNWHSDRDTDQDSDRDSDRDRGVRTRAGTWRVRLGPVDLRVVVQCRPDTSFGRERGSSYHPGAYNSGSYSPGGGWGRMRDEDRDDYDRDDRDYDRDDYDRGYGYGRGAGYGRYDGGGRRYGEDRGYGDRDTVAVRGRWECHALSGGSGDRYGRSGTSVSYPGWDRYGWNPTGTDFGWDGYRHEPDGWADPSSWNGTGPWGGPARMDWVSTPTAGGSKGTGGCWLIRPRQDTSPLRLLGPEQ
jgi:hypothetical protein